MKSIHDDLFSLDLGIYEARDLTQNRPLWRLMSLHSAIHSYCCMLLLVGLDNVRFLLLVSIPQLCRMLFALL